MYDTLRCLQVYTVILNEVHRHIIFMLKVAFLGVCIVCGFTAIAHFGDHPAFGTLYYMGVADAMLMYGVVYRKAFKVSALFKDAVNACTLGMQLNLKLPKGEKGRWRRQLRAIPQLGIKVGDFHVMERISVPVFVNYVVTNVLSMLVAYGLGP